MPFPRLRRQFSITTDLHVEFLTYLRVWSQRCIEARHCEIECHIDSWSLNPYCCIIIRVCEDAYGIKL